MNINKKITDSVNSGVNVIIARFLIAVSVGIFLVVVLSYTGIFMTTMSETGTMLLASVPGAVVGILALCLHKVRMDSRTKYILCILMCLQVCGVALAAYSYVGTIILLFPILMSSLYPRSKISGIVSVLMLICSLAVPPLALVLGLWDGDYYEFLYDLSYCRPMDTATLSSQLLTRQEQILSAIRYCSSQNLLIVGGFALISRLVYRQTNKSFESQKDVLRLSETDELTGLLNRNCFERMIGEIESLQNSKLVCFYFDVNGLHEMNNTKGHKAGDFMLRFVGKKIQEVFGEDNSFRVGGDEYVAFSKTMRPESLPAIKSFLEKGFATQHYHVAIGYAYGSKAIDANNLVQQAEKEMYLDKSKFYDTHECSR